MALHMAIGSQQEAMCRGSALAVNTALQAIPPDDIYCSTHSQDGNCLMLPGYGTHKVPGGATVQKLALFHYITRSKEDFLRKASRGGGNTSRPKTGAFFDKVVRCALLRLSTFVNILPLSCA